MPFPTNRQSIINNNIRVMGHLVKSYEKALVKDDKKEQLDLLERIESYAVGIVNVSKREFENVKKSYTPKPTAIPTDWAMFTIRGNSRVSTLVKKLLKTKSFEEFSEVYYAGRDAIAKAGHGEVYDTAVREEVLGWIFDNNMVPFNEEGL